MNWSAPLYRLAKGFLALFAVLLIGTAGYRIIEGWSFLDSFYMTVITLATVGYGEIHPLSIAGRIFTILLILGGVGTVIYILTGQVQYFIEGEFGIRLGRQRMDAKINALHDHFILCGFGRVGKGIAHTLQQEKAKFVVIEQNEESFAKAQQLDYLAIQDDGTKDEVLKKARIDRAKGLIAAFGDDADNTYVILSARELNPTIPIIARANNEDAIKKLQQAGATHVIAPEAIGGQQMARLAVRPRTVQFIETVLSSKEEDLLVEEINISEDSTFVGSTVKQIEGRFPRIKIVAIKTEDGTILFNPHPETIIEKSGSLTAFGPSKQLQTIEGCCAASETTTKKKD